MLEKNKIHISVVIPVYGCKTALKELYLRLKKTLLQITEEFEIIMVNDASPDNAWEVILELAETDNRVKGLNFSRNFGQHYAITAGLDYCSGDWVVVMDCDLQDQPEEIIKLYNKALEGYDIILARRVIRQDSFFKKLSSRVFYSIFSYLTETKQDSAIANFGIYNKKVINAILSMRDSLKYFPTMVQWVGFKKTGINVKHGKRGDGQSSYSFYTLTKLAFNNIIAFSDKPLRLVIKLGFLISFSSFVFGLILIIKYLSGSITVLGYSSLIISLWFLSGIMIAILGVIGIYIGKIFDKVKDRPVFIIKEKINCDDNN